ncbi:3'3'-cGAMP-specific phosphodiesterase 3 [bacterium HR17]|uniref:3'3'-cGAMP-specific phosphodiesterase 3 n=1 Tax=Candidatus Fervidibacter japonicus TaxID=2035412 RepID=A0A2H5XE79_9BACT|nr:3'3'-cGAMP-specific phosphodiesterase 3 [bacterium HR17]
MDDRTAQERIAQLERRVAELEAELAQVRVESQQKLCHLQMVLDLMVQVNASLDLHRVLTAIMHAAERLTDAETSSLLLYDPETDELFFEVATGEKGEAVKQMRLKRGQGIAGHVLETGQPMLVADVTSDARHAKIVDETTGFVTRNLIAVPLRIGDEIKGVLEVLNCQSSTFTEADVNELMAISSLCAVAIDKAQTHQALQELFWDLVRAIVAMLDARNPYTRGHSERVTEFAVAIAREMGLSDEDCERIRLAGLLHDIGKVGIPDAVLLKEGLLTDVEFAVMKQHPEIGYRILAPIKRMRPYLGGVRYHHERLSGKGYPLGLKGDEIPLDARILAVADVFDALTSDRPYRAALEPSAAIEIIRRDVPNEFDSDVFAAFLRAWEKSTIVEQKRRPPLPSPFAVVGEAAI